MRSGWKQGETPKHAGFDLDQTGGVCTLAASDASIGAKGLPMSAMAPPEQPGKPSGRRRLRESEQIGRERYDVAALVAGGEVSPHSPALAGNDDLEGARC
jgi:hypothetical protein